jgi:hypothetical protein
MPHWYAPIGPRTEQQIRQFRAWFEPGNTVGDLLREEMTWPRVVVASQQADGVFLYRYGAEGDFAGDTWHQSLEDAHRQAEFEYGPALGGWYEIPDHIPDRGVAEFAVSAVRPVVTDPGSGEEPSQ